MFSINPVSISPFAFNAFGTRLQTRNNMSRAESLVNRSAT
jgi:hypothetical protein